MMLKDLSYWGLLKTTLVVTFLIPAFLMLVITIMAVTGVVPDYKVNIELDEPAKILGILIMGGFPVWLQSIIAWIINLMVATKIIQLLARHTPLGKIRIG